MQETSLNSAGQVDEMGQIKIDRKIISLTKEYGAGPNSSRARRREKKTSAIRFTTDWQPIGDEHAYLQQ